MPVTAVTAPATSSGATAALGARIAPPVTGQPAASAAAVTASPAALFVVGAMTSAPSGALGTLPAAPAQARTAPAAPRLPNAGTGGLLGRSQDQRGVALRLLLLAACCLALSGLSLQRMRRT
ncbi:MAG TPA: hypothetical protein VFD32_02145 [Dehalococcoidia bacterium]|nr:hypothetical protein [Dehalococcoidia bacterium]